MTGYSGTPLAKKLGLKRAIRVHLDSAPRSVREELKSALAEVKLVKGLEPELDFILGFAISQFELKKSMPIWKSHLSMAGQLWIAWPKKTSDLATDLTDQIVREIGLKASLVDVKVCAIDTQWSGLKFVYRKRDR
jgi:hypothetical protein